MKKILLSLLFAVPTLVGAQSEYVRLNKPGSLSFVPATLSADGNAVMHILQADGIGIYDNDIAQIKNIPISSQSFTYISSQQRTRDLLVERTSFNKIEDITNVYSKYAQSRGFVFAELSREDKIMIIDLYEWENSETLRVTTEGDITYFTSRYLSNYFNNNYNYPKHGILLDANELVYRFTATYENVFGEWGEYVKEYATIESEKNIFLCNNIDAQGNVPTTNFYITSSLFNGDAAFEYIRPLYVLVDDGSTDYEIFNSDRVVIGNGTNYSKKLAIKGLEFVSEDGRVINSIQFEKEYDEIAGNFQILGNNLVYKGYDITIMQYGGNRFITFDTQEKDDEGNSVLYKHFYKIAAGTNSLEAVGAPVCMKVFRSGTQSIDVRFDTEKESEVTLNTLSGQQCAVQKVAAGSGGCSIDVPRGAGTYIVTLSEEGTLVDSKKIVIE